MWIQDTLLKKKKFTRSDTVVKRDYFTADVGENVFILAPPVQSKKKSFIADIEESQRASGSFRDDSFMANSRESSKILDEPFEKNNYNNEKKKIKNIKISQSEK